MLWIMSGTFKVVSKQGWLKIKTAHDVIMCCVKLTFYFAYTLLTLKYGVVLLNAPVSCVLRQNMRTILTATGSVEARFPIALL